jgi:hypothetical protein
MPSPESTMIDARPIIERNDANAWTRASAHRDEVYEALMQACAQESVEGLVLKSPPAVYPPWIKFEAWVPRAGRTTTERIGAVATIGAKPFHRHPLEIEIACTRHGRSRTFLVREPLTGSKVHALVRYLLDNRDAEADIVVAPTPVRNQRSFEEETGADETKTAS